jgi:hypothetical protein
VNTGVACHTDKKNDAVSEEAKKECKESEAKCSRAQTSFGEIGYFLNSNIKSLCNINFLFFLVDSFYSYVNFKILKEEKLRR